MTPAELESLSRAAAAKLNNEHLPRGCFLITRFVLPYERTGMISGMHWLHDSTEACAEIMVRQNITFYSNLHNGNLPFVMVDWPGAKSRIQVFLQEVDNDPMLAFRVAVLRVVVAL